MFGNLNGALKNLNNYSCRSFFQVLIFMVFICLPCCLFANGNEISFHNIKNEDGLSQNSVNCILQDSLGFMWFGTEDGLNKYDGLSFTFYKFSQKNPNSLTNSSIQCLCEDSEKNLWIGTYHGLNRLNLKTGQITRFLNIPNNPESISHNGITAIYEDKKDVLWIGTSGGGLNRFEPEKNSIIHFTEENKP